MPHHARFTVTVVGDVDAVVPLLRGAGYDVGSVQPDAVLLVGAGAPGPGPHVPHVRVPVVAVSDDPQEVLLRVGLACRRGRAIRTALHELGVEVSSPEHRSVSRRGCEVRFTLTEFSLLRAIILGGGDVVPRESLVRSTWRGRRHVAAATLDSHIRAVRAKLRRAGIPLTIRTRRGIGYAWALPA